jgi:hypothetical protein
MTQATDFQNFLTYRNLVVGRCFRKQAVNAQPRRIKARADGSGTAAEAPPGARLPTAAPARLGSPPAANKFDELSVPAPKGSLDESKLVNANPLESASALPAASEAAIVTIAGVPAVPPMTKALWKM